MWDKDNQTVSSDDRPKVPEYLKEVIAELMRLRFVRFDHSQRNEDPFLLKSLPSVTAEQKAYRSNRNLMPYALALSSLYIIVPIPVLFWHISIAVGLSVSLVILVHMIVSVVFIQRECVFLDEYISRELPSRAVFQLLVPGEDRLNRIYEFTPEPFRSIVLPPRPKSLKKAIYLLATNLEWYLADEPVSILRTSGNRLLASLGVAAVVLPSLTMLTCLVFELTHYVYFLLAAYALLAGLMHHQTGMRLNQIRLDHLLKIATDQLEAPQIKY